jgi:hypothetical protein
MRGNKETTSVVNLLEWKVAQNWQVACDGYLNHASALWRVLPSVSDADLIICSTQHTNDTKAPDPNCMLGATPTQAVGPKYPIET